MATTSIMRHHVTNKKNTGFINMSVSSTFSAAFLVIGPESNRTHLGCGKTGDSWKFSVMWSTCCKKTRTKNCFWKLRETSDSIIIVFPINVLGECFCMFFYNLFKLQGKISFSFLLCLFVLAIQRGGYLPPVFLTFHDFCSWPSNKNIFFKL